MKTIIDILKEANCSFSYNYQTQKITTISGEDITPHLFAVFERIDKVEDEYWREKVAKSFNLPVDMLFPEKEKIGKYNFVRDKKPKVYLSGPITGRDEKKYMNDFNSAELWLTGLGYDVVNPVSYTSDPNWSWEDYMRRDIKLLLDCDYIYLLDNWEYSKGARVEYNIACDVGITPLRLDESGKVV
jgi:hypothetical protein